MDAAPVQRATARGTPCARTWDEDWADAVEQRETELGRRICGARTIGGTPCTLPSDHASGRCRHHGGFPLTGARPDNRNGIVHGLYSRRLMVCGTHCPAWQSCPMGGGATFSLGKEEVEPKGAAARLDEVRGMGGSPMRPAQGNASFASDSGSANPHGRAAHATREISYAQQLMRLPLSERPLCPYEQAEYQAVVTDVQRRTCARDSNAMGVHLAHTVALLSVMVSRASRALAVQPLIEKYEQSGEDFYASLNRPSAALAAFERLTAELRRWLQHVERNYSLYTDPTRAALDEFNDRRAWDTRHDPDAAPAGPAPSGPPEHAPSGGETRTSPEPRTNGDAAWAAFDAINDVLDRADRRDAAKPPPIAPGDRRQDGPGP